jgi:hypothetical protein
MKWLLFIVWWCCWTTSALLIRNRTVNFVPSSLRTLFPSSVLIAKCEPYCTTVPVDADGFYGVINSNTFLIGQDTEAHMYLHPITHLASYTDEMKYFPHRIHNVSKHIVRTIPSSFFVNKSGCTHKQFKPYSVYLVTKCNVSEWITHPHVLSVDRAPKLTLKQQHLRDAIQQQLETTTAMTVTTQSLVVPSNRALLLVSDTCLDLSHCAFQSLNSTVLTIPDLTGGSCIAGAHGTFTSGIAVGSANCKSGVSGQAPNNPLLFGTMSPLDEPEGQEELVFSSLMIPDFFENGYVVNTHSASWGETDDVGQYTESSVMYDQVCFDDPGIMQFFAVGNNGLGQPGLAPSTAKCAMSTGALNENNNGVASFTCTGNLQDGRTSPLIYCPGTYVWAPYSLVYPPGLTDHRDYAQISGTSAATPFAAGISIRLQNQYYSNNSFPSGPLVGGMMLAKKNDLYKGYNNLPVVAYENLVVRGLRIDNGQTVRQSYCFTPSEGFSSSSASQIVVLKWYEMPSVAYTDAPTLINNLDMYIVPYNEQTPLIIGEDSLHTNEQLNVSVSLSAPIRVVFFTRQPLVGNITVGLYMTSNTAWTSCIGEEQDLITTTSCLPGETISCGNNNTTSYIQQCLPNGTYSACSGCAPGYSNYTGYCECDPTLYVDDTAPHPLCGPHVIVGDGNHSIQSDKSARLAILSWLLILFFVI